MNLSRLFILRPVATTLSMLAIVLADPNQLAQFRRVNCR